MVDFLLARAIDGHLLGTYHSGSVVRSCVGMSSVCVQDDAQNEFLKLVFENARAERSICDLGQDCLVHLHVWTDLAVGAHR